MSAATIINIGAEWWMGTSMTNYIKTRADELKVGDVVRDPYSGSPPLIREVRSIAPIAWRRSWVSIELKNGEAFTAQSGELVDRLISDDEAKALEAPEDW